MEPLSQSQSQIPIKQRDIHFDVTGLNPATWHPLGPHVAHFQNAMSVFFPEGEKFFINSVRNYQHKVTDPKLQDEVKGFIGQEAMHGREHRAYNAWLASHGYPVERLEHGVIKTLEVVSKTTTKGHQLGATIALEHLTSIMAESLLGNLKSFEGADPRIVALWRWHAIEETEHKAVAYDVYRAAFGKGLFAWLQRVIVFLFTCLQFWVMVGYYHWQFLKKDGLQWQMSGWWTLFKFLWITPGALRQTILPWLDYLRPGFHPWDHDNRERVDEWKSQQAAQGQAS